MPMTADAIRAGLLPYLISYPLRAADTIRVSVEQDPMMLSFTVAVEPLQPNLTFKAGVIWLV